LAAVEKFSNWANAPWLTVICAFPAVEFWKKESWLASIVLEPADAVPVKVTTPVEMFAFAADDCDANWTTPFAPVNVAWPASEVLSNYTTELLGAPASVNVIDPAETASLM